MTPIKKLCRFSATTIEALNYYVYVLVDPSDNKIFYVGKGKGNRVFNHIAEVKKKMHVSCTMSPKDIKIANIISSGEEVLTYIVRYGLTNEHALLIESVLIDIFSHKLDVNLNDFNDLTNEITGYYSSKGCISTYDLEKLYSDSNVAELNDGAKYLAINISILSKDPIEIYNRVRASWNINKEIADKADYILATHAGLIVGVYKLDANKWIEEVDQTKSNSTRYYFNEDKSVDMTEIRTRLINKRLPKKRKKGAANPVWYIAGWK